MRVQEQALSPKEEADRMEDEKQAAKLLSAALLGCDTRQKKIPRSRSLCVQAEQAVNEKKEKADAKRKSKEKRAMQFSEDIEKKKDRLNAKSARILLPRAESKRTFEVVFVALTLSIVGLSVVQASAAREVSLTLHNSVCHLPEAGCVTAWVSHNFACPMWY